MSRSNPMHHGRGPEPLIDDDDAAQPGMLPDYSGMTGSALSARRESGDFLPLTRAALPPAVAADSDDLYDFDF